MMANSSRDPYWQAAVRREVLDHPAAADAIQDECATCHMPMSRTEARLNGDEGEVFDHLPVTDEGDRSDRLAHDGVACSLCHQITDRNLGTPASFTGGYVVSPPVHDGSAPDVRTVQDRARHDDDHAVGDRLSSRPRRVHVRQSELCATCHTLVTKARGPEGRSHRRAARADAVSGMEAQRVRGRTAQLPVLPYARRRGGHADRVGAGRAAQRLRAPHLHRRKFLHAAHAQPVSRRPGCRRDEGRDGGVDRRDARQSSEIDGRTVDRSSRTIGRPADRRRPRAEPDGPQAADRISIAPRMAALHRSRSRRAHGVRIGSCRAERRDSRQRQRCRCGAASSRITPRSARRIRCRFTSRS